MYPHKLFSEENWRRKQDVLVRPLVTADLYGTRLAFTFKFCTKFSKL